MYKVKNIIILLCLLFFKVSVFSQNTDSVKYINISAKYSIGYIYAHHESLKYFIKDYVPSFEANIGFRKKGDKIWHSLYRYPTVGFGYYYANLGNPEVLGNTYALLTYIDIPVLEKKNFTLYTKYAVGVAWLSKSYNLYNNNYNIAIGSKLNAYLNIYIKSKLKLSKQINLITGFGITHYSNGGTTQPNLGLNIISASVGLSYKIHKQEFTKQKYEIPQFKKKNEYSVIIAAGSKTLQPARTERYSTFSLSLNAERRFSYKGKYGFGIDIFKDNSRKEYLKDEDIENPSGLDLYYAGGHASYDFIFGRTSFTVQMGAYFFNKSKFFEAVYHRFGVKYSFSNNLIANITLRSFWAAADFPEFGIGYKF